MHRKKRAFTLIELLVVIAIIAAIGSGAVLLVKWNSSKQSLLAAQQQLMSAFEEARILACAKATRARVLIYKGDDVSRKLRQVGIIYEAFDEYGDKMGWVSHSSGAMLPKGVFFIPPSGEFKTLVDLNSAYKESDVIKSTFRNGLTGAPSVVGMSNFGSRVPQSIGEGGGDWYCYEFSPEGLSENPSAVIVLGIGSVNNKGRIVLENPFEIMGFSILKMGKVVGFREYAEIEGNVKN